MCIKQLYCIRMVGFFLSYFASIFPSFFCVCAFDEKNVNMSIVKPIIWVSLCVYDEHNRKDDLYLN